MKLEIEAEMGKTQMEKAEIQLIRLTVAENNYYSLVFWGKNGSDKF